MRPGTGAPVRHSECCYTEYITSVENNRLTRRIYPYIIVIVQRIADKDLREEAWYESPWD